MEKHFLFLNVKIISHLPGNNFSIFFSQTQYIVSATEVIIDFTALKAWKPRSLHYNLGLENMNKMPILQESQDQ